MSNRRTAGIREVAERAGVSMTTVSHALNRNPNARIAEATLRRVENAARELGYEPNRIAQNLRAQRSGLIAVLGDTILTTPFAFGLILGAQESAIEHGFTLLMFNTEGDPATEKHDVETIRKYRVDGVIYATTYHREVKLPAGLSDTPTVVADATTKDETTSWIVPDEYGGARTAMAELLAAGHTRIGYLSNEDDIPATHMRLRAYRDALLEAGLSVDDSLVAFGSSDAEGGFRTSWRLLDRPDRPTAVFCFNDRMAMGVYRTAFELGLRIRDDVALVGFDDQEVIASGIYPGLTTVALPHREMGRWAVHTLVELLDDPGMEPRREIQPCPLVRRQSVAPPNLSNSDLLR